MSAENKQISCAGCRYHATEKRNKLIDVLDESLELIEVEDDPPPFYVCRHKSAGVNGYDEVGYEPEKRAAACATFEAPHPQTSAKMEALEKRLRERFPY